MAMQKVGLRAVFETAEFQRGVTIYNNGIVQVNNYAKQAEQQSKKSSQAVEQGWTKSFKKVATAAVALIAAYKSVVAATRGLQESVQLAARVETLGVALETVGKNAGYSKTEIESFQKAVETQGITTQAARQSLLMMAQAQIDWTHSAELARIAQDAAVIANVNSSEAFERLTYVIQSGNVRMARTLGFQVSFQKAYERTAAELGKTTDELTEQERVQARVNEVIRAGAQIAGTYEAAMGTAGKQLTSLARHLEQVQLALGQIALGAFGAGIEEITRLIKQLRGWIEENQAELEDMAEAVTMLTESLIQLADLDVPVEELTTFVEDLTTLVSILSVGIETVSKWNTELKIFGERISAAGVALDIVVPGLRQSLALGREQVGQLTELRKENEELFKTEKQFWDWRQEAAGRTDDLIKEQIALRKANLEIQEEETETTPKSYEEAAEAATEHLDKVAKLHRDHYRKLAEMEADRNRQRAREEQQYYRAVEKEVASGEKRLTDITERYEDKRDETIRDAEERIAEAEQDIYKDRERAQRDYERQRKQQEERYRLDRLQSERRYQYEWARTLAEGDALALYYMQQEHELEKQEAAENQDLQQKQTKENYEAQVKDMEESARELVEELRQNLQEQLQEQEQAYQEQIAKQKEVNAERLAEMAVNFEEQQALREEDAALAQQQQEETYRRQLEDLGASMADQEELRELGEQQVKRLYDQYWSESGENELIMQGWHEREQTRITITEDALLGLADSASEVAVQVEESVTAAAEASSWMGWSGVTPMQHGGVLRGPAMAYIEPGMTEMFIPLSGPSTMNVTGNIGVGVSGLERASPSLVNRIASQVGTKLFSDISSEIQERRRGA